jgi:ADP-ribose pyrophosphatase YjhB (NUDIX family)
MLLIIRKKQVLLMRRINTGFGDGLWGLPGGGLDGGEPIKEAVIREASEELGIHLARRDLEFTSCLHVAPHFRTPVEMLLFNFRAKKYRGHLCNKEPHKCSEIRFFPLTSLPHDILEGSHLAIQNYLSHTPFSELHWKGSHSIT